MGVVDLKDAGVSDKEKVKIVITEIVPNDRCLSVVRAWDGDSERPGTYQEVPNPLNATGTTAPTETSRKLIPPLYDQQFHSEANQKKLIEIMNEKEVQYQAVPTSGRHNEFNWVDFENDLGALSGLNITKTARNHDGMPIDDPFHIRIELWDTKDNVWTSLSVGSVYWILQEGQIPTDQTKHLLTKEDNGLFQIQNGRSTGKGRELYVHALPLSR